MTLSLEQLTAAFKKQDTSESRPSNYYRFWDMEPGQQAVVRFLPDKDGNNPFGFMVEKFMHNLTINGEGRSVPCLKMYGEDCPVCKVSQAYYKDEGKDSPNGKKYWRKKQNIVQALIMEDPLAANPETGENSEGKVRFLNLGFQIMSVIKEAIESGELDAVPFLYEGGCDFIIKKTMIGDNAKYDVGSKFARRSSDLTDEEIAIAEESTVDLSTLLPASLGLEKVEQMLEADLTGNAYADDNNAQASATPAAAATPAATSAKVEEAAPVAKEAAPTEEFAPSAKSNDILAKIRERKNKSAE